jgi:hypothetical protein
VFATRTAASALLEPAEKLTDATALAGPLISAGSMFAFFAAHQADVFRDADYADLLGPDQVKPERGNGPVSG